MLIVFCPRSGRGTHRGLRTQEQSLHATLGRLQAISPLATLARGYAVVRRTENGLIIRAAEEVTPGEDLSVKLARGQLLCRVNRVQPADTAEEHGPTTT